MAVENHCCSPRHDLPLLEPFKRGDPGLEGLAFRSLDLFRALREPDRRRRDEKRPFRSEQKTATNQNDYLTGKAPYKLCELARAQGGSRTKPRLSTNRRATGASLDWQRAGSRHSAPGRTVWRCLTLALVGTTLQDRPQFSTFALPFVGMCSQMKFPVNSLYNREFGLQRRIVFGVAQVGAPSCVWSGQVDISQIEFTFIPSHLRERASKSPGNSPV
jgi:hypothetical protein